MGMFAKCSRGVDVMMTSFVTVTLLVTMSTTCSAAFLSPPLLTPNLAQTVTATCSGAGSCTSNMNEATCSSAKVCRLGCQSRSDFPQSEIPLLSWTSSSQTTGCTIGTDPPSNAPSFANSSNGLLEFNSTASQCTVSKPGLATTSSRMALSFWIRSACTNNCTFAEINTQSGSPIRAYVSNNKLCINSFCDMTPLNSWRHIILQVNANKVDIMMDGGASSIMSPTVSPLSTTVSITLGASTSLVAGNSYQLYDVRYYSDILTSREILNVYNNTGLGAIPVPACRCPYTHPTLNTGDPYTCTSSAGDTNRLSKDFFPPQTLVDGDASSFWAAPSSGDFNLTVTLDQEYQLETVEVAFQSSVPNSANVMMSLPRQTFQLNCTSSTCSFSKTLTGPFVTRDEFAGYVGKVFNLTFIQLGSNPVLSSITVTGRCNCNGNAATCDTSVTPYVCACNASTNTTGSRCENCLSNRYHRGSQFDCQGQCNCNVTGAKNSSQTCGMDDGRCICKDNVEGTRCDMCKAWTFGLSDTSSQGCRDCSCHRAGSQRCDPDSGECTCNTNVSTPQCSQCLDNFYDAGPAAGPDDCQPCDCNSSGAKPGSVCDKNTGQCPCKSYVQGRTCNECMDEYYNLEQSQPKGCLKCECNLVGSISNICNKANGQCPCEDGSTLNRICAPFVQSVSPTYGPMIGGTRVTITGRLLGNSSKPPSVALGNLSQDVLSANISTIIFNVSNPSTGVVTMKIIWDQQDLPLNASNFTFGPNPVLDETRVPAVSLYTSGGCGVIFKGNHFDSVANPQMAVTDGSTGTTVFGQCVRIHTDLRCIGPDLSPLGSSPLDNLTFGLHLDGVEYVDLGSANVRGDPSLHDLGSYDLQYPFETTVVITGSRLTEVCQQSEISILLGVLSCDIVRLTDNEIECEPPRNLQGKKGTDIKVKIGANFERRVGQLNYLEFWETSYFIGIMCGIGALIVLILVIIVLCRCRRRSSMNTSKRQSQMRLMEKAANGSPAPQNQYSELPNAGGAVNNGFQDPIQAETVIREPKEIMPPTVKEFDQVTEFLNRVEPSLWDAIRTAAVSSSDLTLGRLCTNRGNYARIIDGQFATERAGQRTEKKVTIKTLKDPLPAEGMLPQWATGALRECLRLHRHSDDNVLSIIGLAVDKERFHMVYPYMQNRTLKDHIVDANKEFSVRQLVEFGLQVSEGLGYLHGKDLIHKDLAARNCMVDAADVVKISDAAFSWDFYGDEYVFDSDRGRYIPVRWMAPESLTDGYYDKRTDVWSLGVLLWELLTRGCLPFHEVQDAQVKDYITEGYMLGKPENCSDHLYEVMKECWGAENELRPNVSAIVNQLGEELTGGGVEQDDIYVNLGTVEGYYENQDALGKPRRKAPSPPKA